jgi:poly(A) polymerase
MGTVTQWILAAMAVLTVIFLARRFQARRARMHGIEDAGPSQIVINWDQGPPGQIAVQDWMAAPETVAVMAAIAAEGDEARFAGGCVRDAILKRPIKDIDIATTATPERVTALLKRAGIKAIPTGIEHGTVTALVGHKHFEITTLRRDVATDGRRATVDYTDDWRADAQRRDFTVNAMSLTRDGSIYDYFNGMQDLADRVIRFVGPPKQRIAEDYLRILRFFRFIAVYRMRVPGTDALAAIRAAAPQLATLSGERVRDELLRILASEHAAEALNLMRGEHVLEVILPEADGLERLRKLIWLETRAMGEDGQYADPLRRLAALIDADRAGAEAVADRLRLSNVRKRRLAAMAAPEWRPTADTGDAELRRQLRRIPPETVLDLAFLEWARHLAATDRLPAGESDAWRRMVEAAETWLPDEFPLRGRDVLDLGVPQGPHVKELLLAVEAWWEDGGFKANRDACLARLRKEIDGAP